MNDKIRNVLLESVYRQCKCEIKLTIKNENEKYRYTVEKLFCEQKFFVENNICKHSIVAGNVAIGCFGFPVYVGTGRSRKFYV